MALAGGMGGRQLPSGALRTGRRARRGSCWFRTEVRTSCPWCCYSRLSLFPQPSRDGPLSPVGGMAGLRRLGGRRRTGGRADWQAVAIICRGGALGGRQFCHASARPHNPPLNSRRGPAVVCRWDNWSASARRRATNTQTGRSGGGACDLPRRWCARLCLFLRYRLQETAGCRAFK